MSEQRERVLLLEVADRFQVGTYGLVLLPDFSIPNGWKNVPIKAEMTVTTPAGVSSVLPARVEVTHFNLSDPNAGADRAWRLIVVLPTARKEDIPVGTKVLADPELVKSIRGSA